MVMKITKRHLKRIIREEKSKLLSEWFSDEHDPETGERDQFEDPMEGVREELLNLASREEGISLDEIQNFWGPMGFDLVDELSAEDLVWLDDQEAVVYATSRHQRSTGLDPAVRSYVGESKTKLNKREDKMKITKRQLRRIIKEEKVKLLKEQPEGLQTYRVTMLVAVAPGQEEYILNSIEDGMEFDEDMGEGVLEYDIKAER
jgi:hypothetical protein